MEVPIVACNNGYTYSFRLEFATASWPDNWVFDPAVSGGRGVDGGDNPLGQTTEDVVSDNTELARFMLILCDHIFTTKYLISLCSNDVKCSYVVECALLVCVLCQPVPHSAIPTLIDFF